MNNTIILTGGTGILGKFLIGDLLKTQAKLILLVRKPSYKKALEFIASTFPSSTKTIDVIVCDLSQEGIGLSKKQYEDLCEHVTHILHAAASTSFNMPLDEARKNNVEPTKNMLLFAKDCQNLTRFAYISTAYVCGKRTGIIKEEDFEHSAGFVNTYQQSKYEAEELVRKEKEAFPIVIFRPSIIVTPYKTTSDSPVNALTMGVIFARKGFLPILPGNDTYRLDLISGQFVSSAIAQLLIKTKEKFITYHVTSSAKAPLIKDVIVYIEDKDKKKLATRFCGAIESFRVQLSQIVTFRPDLKIVYEKLNTFLPELAYSKEFENTNLLKDLGIIVTPGNPVNEIKALVES